MAKLLRHRTDNDIKNKWYAMARKRDRHSKSYAHHMYSSPNPHAPMAYHNPMAHHAAWASYPTIAPAEAYTTTTYGGSEALDHLATVATLPSTHSTADDDDDYSVGRAFYDTSSLDTDASKIMDSLSPRKKSAV
jgi:hypothetical protein